MASKDTIIKELKRELEGAYEGNRQDRAAHEVTKTKLTSYLKDSHLAWEIVKAFTTLINKN